MSDDTTPQEAAPNTGKWKLPKGADWLIATAELWIESHGGPVRAHNPGDLVPAANVEAMGWHDRVRPAKDGEIPPPPVVG